MKHFLIFLTTFILGVAIVYNTAAPSSTIIVYPTPDNATRVEYKDQAGNCYVYAAEKIECPASGAVSIPLQE